MRNRYQILDIRSQKENKRQGFTLVELLVVISIIGLLVAVLVANFMGARERAKDSQRIQDLNAIKSALRLYYNDHQSYPIGAGTSEVLTSASGVGLTLATSNYIKEIGASGAIYAVGNSGDTFILKIKLDSVGGTDDITSQVKCGVAVTQPTYYVVCAN